MHNKGFSCFCIAELPTNQSIRIIMIDACISWRISLVPDIYHLWEHVTYYFIKWTKSRSHPTKILPTIYPYVPDKERYLPRKEYKTITVKNESYEQFKKAVREAKRKDKSLDNSTFLNVLISQHQRSRKSWQKRKENQQ